MVKYTFYAFLNRLNEYASANNIIEIIRTRQRFGDCVHNVTTTANNVCL